MPQIVLTKAEHQEPSPADLSGDRDCMPAFLIEGTCDGEPFACTVAFEIDGRDCDTTHISGPVMDVCDDQERWEDFLIALNAYEPWYSKFRALSASYGRAAWLDRCIRRSEA